MNHSVGMGLVGAAQDRRMIDHEIRVSRIDNGDGTHSLLVDDVQIGPPFPYDDMAIEHYVRRTCERLQKLERVPPTITYGGQVTISPPSSPFVPSGPNVQPPQVPTLREGLKTTVPFPGNGPTTTIPAPSTGLQTWIAGGSPLGEFATEGPAGSTG